MEKKPVFAVIGGDRRQFFAAEFLKDAGYPVYTFAMAQGLPYADMKTIQADIYLLPLPVSRDGMHLYAPESEERISLSDIKRDMPPDALVFAGLTDEKLWFDYAKSEYFALQNALPTAEGALLLAMQNRNSVLCGSSVGIIGFGKIGKAVAALFSAVGAEIFVFARRDEIRAEIRALGYTAYGMDALSTEIQKCRLLINTVPERILDERMLSQLSKDTFFLELASSPYGADPDTVRRLGVRNLIASGIPGRFFPKTAGIAVAKTVLHSITKG